MKKKYKEPKIDKMETTINILYSENQYIQIKLNYKES